MASNLAATAEGCDGACECAKIMLCAIVLNMMTLKLRDRMLEVRKNGPVGNTA